ncbi:MAG: TetR/AcrR family transcriptional regulator [Candidatus Cyclobacteriaceae bacterium M3_2C_046]
MNFNSGRINQKIRTRESLIEAANQLLKKGKADFSLEEVAREAKVSTATAYRYFTDPETLRLEAPLQFKTEKSEKIFENIPKKDWQQRLEQALKYHQKLCQENEVEFRLFLSSVLRESVKNPGGKSRGGRRVVLAEEALADLKGKISKDDFSRLKYVLSVFMGIESVIVLKDICGLKDEEVLPVWQWAGEILINSLLRKTEKKGKGKKKKAKK